MGDWRNSDSIEEVINNINDWRIDIIADQLYTIDGFILKDITRINEYDDEIGERILEVLLEWACYGQSTQGIELGRKIISFIPKAWLQQHILNTVLSYFEYDDYWKYRRLLEVVASEVPELILEIISINKDSKDKDIIETIDDYS